MAATSAKKDIKKMFVEVDRGDTFRSDITTSRSYIFGTVFKDEVVLIDKEYNIYTTSLKLNHTYKVCEQGKDIYSCAPLKDDRIVCGTIHGTILIYDQHWDLIKEIDLRRPPISSSNTAQYVCVDVDEDDMILAAIFGDTVVQVFSADSSEAKESLTADDLPIRDIRALSYGRVIARICKPNGTDLSFVNHSGTLMSPWSSFFYDKYIWSVSVDRSCDTLYVIYWDDQRQVYSVSVVALLVGVIEDRIIDFKGSEDRCNGPTCAVTDPGKFVIYYNGEFQSYRVKVHLRNE